MTTPKCLGAQIWQICPCRSTPCQLSIDASNTVTPTLAELPPINEHRCLEYCYTKPGRCTPSIEHRCLEYCYTKLGRSTGISTSQPLSTFALNTATPNLADFLADLPLAIKHRYLEYHYTKLGRCTGRSTPHQSSMDDLNTTTRNLADLPPH